MRHRRDGRHLSRTAEHRRALLRNLVTELFRHERIETTVAKAKEARRVAERMITFAKRGPANLAARRHVEAYLFDETVAKKLFDTIAPWYAERRGGYTRILRSRARLGDAGEMAYFELVKTADQKEAERQAREAAAAAAAEASAGKGKGGGKKKKADGEEGAEAAEKKGRGARPTRDSGARPDLTRMGKGPGGGKKGPKRSAMRESRGS